MLHSELFVLLAFSEYSRRDSVSISTWPVADCQTSYSKNLEIRVNEFSLSSFIYDLSYLERKGACSCHMPGTFNKIVFIIFVCCLAMYLLLLWGMKIYSWKPNIIKLFQSSKVMLPIETTIPLNSHKKLSLSQFLRSILYIQLTTTTTTNPLSVSFRHMDMFSFVDLCTCIHVRESVCWSARNTDQ